MITLEDELKCLSEPMRSALDEYVIDPFEGTPDGVILSGNMHPRVRKSMIDKGYIGPLPVPGCVSAYALTQLGKDIRDTLASRCADCLESLNDPEHHCQQCGDHVDGLGECQSGCES